MIGIKDGKEFELSGELKKEMDRYIDSFVLFISGISTKYAFAMSDAWNDDTTFKEHYESNLNFRNTIDNSLEVMLKGFFDIGDVEGAPSKELRDVAVYDFMKNDVLSHLNSKTKKNIVNSYSKYNIEAYASRVKNLIDSRNNKDIDTITTIVEVNFANSIITKRNPLSPILLQEEQKFSQWRKSDSGSHIVKDFIRLSIYLYLGGDAYAPDIQEYLNSVDIPHSFVEIICFELDELTGDDFIQRLQKRIDDGEVSR